MKTWIVVAAATLVGCGSGNGATDMAGPADLAVTDSASQKDMAVPKDMAMTMDMAQKTLSCASYCTTVLANCVGATMSVDAGAGLTAFDGMTACMNACAKFPVGTIADTMGNTLGCRTYHANLAGGSMANAMTHCPHAGLSGGGMCGDRCTNFCALATSICTVADGVTMPVFSSNADCLTKCGTAPFAFNPSLPEMVIDGPTLNCAFYHLGEAFADPYDVDAGTAATASAAGGHCDDFNPNNAGRGCQ